MAKPTVHFQDLGLIGYQAAWDYQKTLHQQAIEVKINNRDTAAQMPQQHHLLFCEHQPVYTLGKSGAMENLLLSEEELLAKNIDFFKINRGGDITYHGPGQIVAYPIFDLDFFFTDVHRYVRTLEEAVILTLADYGLEAIRMKDFTGVWLPATAQQPYRKICAIGVHLSRWVTMHGLAFNINPDLQYFRNIVPCGIDDADKDVTSMAVELHQTVDIEDVKKRLAVHFSTLFNFDFV
jgi:lipoyl(octanoyl) transferase